MQVYLKTLAAMALFVTTFSACTTADSNNTEEKESIITPVQVTSVKDSSLTERIELTAVSSYLEKSTVKANINGYIQNVNAKIGQEVSAHQNLFSLITKEAKAIGNTVNALDPAFKFSGVSKVKAAQSGIVVSVNHQLGDYVQDGELLANIVNKNSLVFLLDLPYDLNQIIKHNKSINVFLPDGTQLNGSITGTMPAVDSLAQTQRYIIKVNDAKDIPEGLIARVSLTKVAHTQAQVLPKSAVLSNETEEEFWVMKMLNDSTAVKVNVTRGLVSDNLVEVLLPRFSKNDRIITAGNYGIADTAKVKIEKK